MILYNPKMETCKKCKRTTANYLLQSGNGLCPSCDLNNPDKPLIVKSPTVGSNWSAHMAAKQARHRKKVDRQKKRR